MCDPITIGVASAVMTGASMFQQAQAQKANLQAQAAQANYQAQVARNNQIIAERNAVRHQEISERRASEIEKQGEREANQYRRKVREFSANQLVTMAGQGADVTVGSNVDLLADTARLGEFDAQTIEYNANKAGEDTRYKGAMDAYSARVQGSNYGASAGLYESQSANYKSQASNVSPFFSGISGLLQGASTVSSKWNWGGGAGGSQGFVNQANQLGMAF